MFENGKTTAEIAEYLELTPRAIASLCKKFGIMIAPRNHSSRMLSKKELQLYRRLRRKHFPISDISKILKVSYKFLLDLNKHLKIRIRCIDCNEILKINNMAYYNKYCPKCARIRKYQYNIKYHREEYRNNPVYRERAKAYVTKCKNKLKNST